MQYMYKNMVTMIPLSEKDKNKSLIECERQLNTLISKVCDKIE